MTSDQILGVAGLVALAVAGVVIWRVDAVKRVVAVLLGGPASNDAAGAGPRAVGWVGLGTSILAVGILLVFVLAQVLKRSR